MNAIETNQPTTLAAIDIGTNSIHLVVVRLDADGKFEILVKEKESVRLGSGAGDLDHLTDAAMERGIDCLKRFAEMARSLNAEIRAVATSAVREARNREIFVERALIEADLPIEVIAGQEEARLIYLGMLQALPLYDQRILAVDIGGGSTEFLVGERGEPFFETSVKLGAIRLTDRFFPEGKVTSAAVEECRRYIRVMLASLMNDLRQLKPWRAVGSSGTIEAIYEMAIAAQGLNLDSLKENILTVRDLNLVVESILKAARPNEIAKLSGIDTQRADIITAGAILLEEIFAIFKIEKMEISPFALREGVVFDSAMRRGTRRESLADIRRLSVRKMLESVEMSRFPGIAAGPHYVQLLENLTEELVRLRMMEALSDNERLILEASARLHNIGLLVAQSSHHKHSYYIIKNSDQLLGFTRAEVEMIALLSRYHRKALPSKKHHEFLSLPPQMQNRLILYTAILRLVIALDRSYRARVESLELELDQDSKQLICTLRPIRDEKGEAKDISLELWSASLRGAELLSSLVGRKIEFRIE